MSLKQRETKFILRIKIIIIDPQHGQAIDTDTQLIWKLSISSSVSVLMSGFAGLKDGLSNFLDGGWTQ